MDKKKSPEKKSVVYHYSCGNEEILSVDLTIYHIDTMDQEDIYELEFQQVSSSEMKFRAGTKSSEMKFRAGTSSSEIFYTIEAGENCREIKRKITDSKDEEHLDKRVITIKLVDKYHKRPEQLFKTNAWT